MKNCFEKREARLEDTHDTHTSIKSRCEVARTEVLSEIQCFMQTDMPLNHVCVCVYLLCVHPPVETVCFYMHKK